MLSLEDKIFIVQQWHSFQPLATIRRSFRRRDARYHGKNLPSLRTIRYVIDNFQKHGTVLDRRKSHFVNKGRVLSPGKVERVRKVYRRKQKISIRAAARSSRVSQYFVQKILKKVLKKKPYTSTKTERLTASQKLRRVTLRRKLLKLPRLQNILKNTWFTDESWFYSDGIAQRTFISGLTSK